MEIRFDLESAAWLDEIMFDGEGRRDLDLPGGARLRLIGVQHVQSTSEQLIVQFLLENVLTPMAVSGVAMFLYDKLHLRKDQIATVDIDVEDAETANGKTTKRKRIRVEITNAQPEEIVAIIKPLVAGHGEVGSAKKARSR
jgi:hypothetical protein